MNFHETWHLRYNTGDHSNVLLPKFFIIINYNVAEVQKRDAGTTLAPLS